MVVCLRRANCAPDDALCGTISPARLDLQIYLDLSGLTDLGLPVQGVQLDVQTLKMERSPMGGGTMMRKTSFTHTSHRGPAATTSTHRGPPATTARLLL